MEHLGLAVFRTSLTTASMEPRFSVPSLTLLEFSASRKECIWSLPVQLQPNARCHLGHLECPLQSKFDRDPADLWVSSLVMVARAE